MRRISRIFGIFACIAALIALFCVAASASLTDFKTSYSDITYENGYVHIGIHNDATGKAAATDTDGDGKVEQYLTVGYNAYFNEATETLVLISNEVMSGNYGDWDVTSEKNTPGKAYYLVYWAKKSGLGNTDKIKHLEIRGNAAINNLSYGINSMTAVRDVKLDSRITTIYGQKGDTGIFHGLTALVTLGHGSFAKDGTFTPTSYTDGVVDLSGFKTIAPNGNVAVSDGIMLCDYMVSAIGAKKVILPPEMKARSGSGYNYCVVVDGTVCYVLDPSKSSAFTTSAFERDGVWYSPSSSDAKNAQKIASADDIYGGDYSGVVCENVVGKSTSLVELTITAPVLVTIERYAFSGCSSLAQINVTGSVSPDLKIGYNAFSGTTNVNVCLETVEDAEYFGNALNAAGIKNVSINVIGGEGTSGIGNPLKAEGFSIRVAGYNGLRGLFSFNDSMMEKNEEAGFALVEYGVVATSGKIYDECGSAPIVYSRTDEKSIIRVPICAANGSGVNRYVDVATKTFCVTITHFDQANYKSEIYMMSYVVMEKGGVRYHLFCEYEYEKDGATKRAISLFDTANGLYKQGLISPALCPEFDSVVAPILAYGGVTVALPVQKKEFL